jgi:heterodisulfide reductase subunit B
LRYAYYPGCSLLSTSAEYALSAEAVIDALGVELDEVKDWVCCGATPAHATSHLLGISLPAITLAAAQKQGHKDLVTCCAACYSRLKQAGAEMDANAALLDEVNGIIEEHYTGGVNVIHLLELLVHRVGLDVVRAKVTRPLAGLKVACYYGCLISRMPETLRIDKVEYPVLMDTLIAAAGAEVVAWPFKTECCGAALTLARQDTVVRLSGRILEMAQECGADAVAVVCPLCQANLDMYQSNVESQLGRRLGVPVLFFTQLLGLAMGLPLEKLGLDKAIVDPLPLLAGKGLIQGGFRL